jgi:Tfp pilus assembly protein PilZ
MDSYKILQNLESFLVSHQHATLPIAAVRLGIPSQEIEDALRNVHGISFQEFKENTKLAEAFRQLGTDRGVPPCPWENTRSRPRRIIPRTNVRYRGRSLWILGKSFSKPCPLVDLSSGGLALLADLAQLPGKRVTLLLRFPEREDELRVEGNVVYAVATGIAGYRYRIGVQFLPFNDRRGCNSTRVLDVLVQFETAAGSKIETAG